MRVRTLGFLRPRRKGQPPFLTQAPEGTVIHLIHETELGAQAPGSLSALLVPAFIDQNLFATHRDWVSAFLGAGGTLVFNGPLAYPFLDGLTPFRPLPKRGKDDLRVEVVVRDHPLFRGVTDDDLTFRRGVAGFYGRGANPPPPGARVIATVGGMPLDWEWHPPGGGRVLMHGGNDLWMYHEDPTSAARLTPNLLAWCLNPWEIVA